MAMSKDMTTKQKVEYIKDYYKWHIIIALLAVCVIAFASVHFLTKEKYDVRLLYAGTDYFGSSRSDSIYSLKNGCVDITGDGEVLLLFDQFCYGGLNDPQYITTMTATLEKMIEKEDDVFLILADEGRAEMILSMSGKYVLEVSDWAEGISESRIKEVSGVKGAVDLSGSAYFAATGIPADDLYLILLKSEGKNASAFENAKKVAKKLIAEEMANEVS